MIKIAYFSNVSGNTHRFIERLELPALRIPILKSEEPLELDEAFILVTPTYGDSKMENYVPRQVGRFLNNAHNRSLMKGVIASGNINFGREYALAGNLISKKCGVPFLYRFEIMGMPEDIINVRRGLEKL